MSLLAAFARDLRTVTNDLLGRRPEPFARRVALGRHHHVINAFSPRPTTIRKITRETRDAVTIELDASFEFRAGQFVTLLVSIDGVEHRRAYSISTAPSDGRIAVTVKRVGLVSGYLNDCAKEGDRLQLLGPSGSFGDAALEGDELVLIGGGSGVTPLMSIARTRTDAKITMVLGNRSQEDAIFHDALAALPHVRVQHVFGERLDCELPLFSGHYFVCGPEPMMRAVREQLLAMGVDASRIHEEKFTSPTQRKSRVTLTSQRVSITSGNAVRTIVAEPGQTLLEAGLAGGVAMPFSCTMGGCGACRVKRIDGDIEMEEPSCLTDQEKAEGYVLACVARAHSPAVIELSEGG